VAPDYFEFLRDHQFHRQGRTVIVTGHQPDLDVAPALSQVGHRVDAGLGAAQRIDRDVRAATCQRDDLVDYRHRTAGIDDGLGTYGRRKLERPGIDVDGDDACAERPADHDRREADAAATVDHKPLFRLDFSLCHDRPKRGREATTQAGSGFEGHRFGQRYQVRIRIVDGDILGVRSPVCEARLGLSVADLLVAGGALFASPAGADERYRDPVAGPESGNVTPDGLDDPGKLVSRHVRQPDVGIVTHPAVPVTAADAGRLDLEYRAVIGRYRVVDRYNLDGPLERLVDGRAHQSSSCLYMT